MDKHEAHHTSAVIAAAGSAVRMGAGKNKNYLEYKGRTLLSYTLQAFGEAEAVEEIVLVIKEGEEESASRAVSESGIRIPVKFVFGGSTRRRSVLNGLRAVGKDTDFVAVHDGARILITPSDITAVLEKAYETGAAALASRVSDTVALLGPGETVEGYADRDRLCFMQTPQCFRLRELITAHERAEEDGFEATDDTSVYQRYAGDVSIVFAENENMKVTRPEDLPLAESILEKRKR